VAEIKVRGILCDVDIEGELRQYEWSNARWSAEKLIASSPFRYDRQPSFFVVLEPHGTYPAGVWADSGAYDDEWSSGGFVKLLSFLRSETYEETEEYLIETYGVANTSNVTMPALRFRLPRKFKPLAETFVEPAVSRYLLSRGLNEQTQSLYGTGRGRFRGFTAFPWRMADGRLANVKYRATKGKAFFYERGGWPIRRLLFGIDVVWRLNAPVAALCEAEIDAMSWTQATGGRVIGVAVGGVCFSDEQADIIRRSPIKALVLAGDNDKPGRSLNEEARHKLSGSVALCTADYGRYKDANERLQAGEPFDSLFRDFNDFFDRDV